MSHVLTYSTLPLIVGGCFSINDWITITNPRYQCQGRQQSAATTRFMLHLWCFILANISRYFLSSAVLLFLSRLCKKNFLSADFVFVSRFRQQILSANFCCQLIGFLLANVFADVMKMTLTPACLALRQPASSRKSFRLRPARILLLS